MLTKQRKVLLNFLMIILEWYLKKNLRRLKKKDLKYQTNASKIINRSCRSRGR